MNPIVSRENGILYFKQTDNYVGSITFSPGNPCNIHRMWMNKWLVGEQNDRLSNFMLAQAATHAKANKCSELTMQISTTHKWLFTDGEIKWTKKL